jgi:hypothetical protein
MRRQLGGVRAGNSVAISCASVESGCPRAGVGVVI